jgi:hypothetical protein
MRVPSLAIALCVAGSISGCATTEVKVDQDKIRTAMIDLYTNQVIDNLILAANGLPFVQLDYTNATATVTVSENGTIGGSQQVVDNRPLNAAARMAAVTRSITTGWNYGVGATNSNQIALTANPAINNNEIYDAYLEFLTLPGSLRVSNDPPPPGAAHLCRKWKGCYYWVPVEFRTEFLRLSLLANVQRGKRLLPVPDYYAVTLLEITDSFQDDFQKKSGIMDLTIKIDVKVPNDDGRLAIDLDGGKKAEFPVKQFQAKDDSTPVMTDEIVVVFDPKKFPEFKTVDDLKSKFNTGVKLYLKHSRPDSPPSTDDLLRNVRFQLEQIRFNQLRP